MKISIPILPLILLYVKGINCYFSIRYRESKAISCPATRISDLARCVHSPSLQKLLRDVLIVFVLEHASL